MSDGEQLYNSEGDKETEFKSNLNSVICYNVHYYSGPQLTKFEICISPEGISLTPKFVQIQLSMNKYSPCKIITTI